MVLDVGRPPGVVLPPRRAAVEVGGCTTRPASPGSSGNTQRIGWVTEKTQRPPGRSTRHTSRMSRAESATNGTAPKAVKTMSNGRPRTAGPARRPAPAAPLAGSVTVAWIARRGAACRRTGRWRRRRRPGWRATARTGPPRSRSRARAGRRASPSRRASASRSPRGTRRSPRRRGTRRARPGSSSASASHQRPVGGRVSAGPPGVGSPVRAHGGHAGMPCSPRRRVGRRRALNGSTRTLPASDRRVGQVRSSVPLPLPHGPVA